MTQEDKQLLLADLCGRLLYKPKALVNGHLATILGIDENVVIVCIDGNDYKDETVVSADNNSDDVKPYLRPMSSMTEEEAKELSILYGFKDILSIKITDEYIDVIVDDGVCSTETRTIWYDEIISSIEIFDWLNVRHFDYRGLIKKGLAIETPDGMYKEEQQ